MHQITWYYTDANNHYYLLDRVDLSNPFFDNLIGVYFIYYSVGPNTIKTVYVGQGNIKERFQAHREDKSIQAYSIYNNLCVAWSPIAVRDTRIGIEKFLYNRLKPKIGEVPTEGFAIPVYLPWE